MKPNDNEISVVRNAVFMLICQLDSNLSDHISKDKIDSQAIFALTKLVDSYIKLSQTETSFGPKESADNTKLLEDDKVIIEECKESLKMAPRAGLEPATERLTAACSTTELPGNNYTR